MSPFRSDKTEPNRENQPPNSPDPLSSRVLRVREGAYLDYDENCTVFVVIRYVANAIS